MTIEIDLNDDAEQAYEQLLAALNEQADESMGMDDHATAVLKNYLAQEYSKLPPQKQTVPLAAIVNGDGPDIQS